ncbi:DUF998 domain-containing protein [Streptomyces venezuelae]|uniref:DUF998 domain-containing protein n=1 Tax=Streptomyces venezuelae TaxID=54571 RepID=UPI0037903AAA
MTHSRRAPGPRNRSWTVAVPLAVAALLYNAWLLEALVPTGLDARHSYVSELYAESSPYRWLFGGLELGCAVLVVAGATAGGIRAVDGIARAGWWALAGVGVSSVADVLMPMTCAPSLQPDCRPVHPAHTLTSAAVHFCLFASLILIIRGARARARQHGMPDHVARWGPPLGVAALVSSLCTVGPLLGYGGWHGVAQRCHLLLVGAWLAMLALGALREARPEAEAAPAAPATPAAPGAPSAPVTPAAPGRLALATPDSRGKSGRPAPKGALAGPPDVPLSPDPPPDRAG